MEPMKTETGGARRSTRSILVAFSSGLHGIHYTLLTQFSENPLEENLVDKTWLGDMP